MIVMGTCAILFWALFSKALAPENLDISTCLQLSASYFLPGLDKPELSIIIPNWVSISASVTAWIIFVLYLSPAGNLIPDKQKLYINQLALTRKAYKNCVFAINKQIDELNKSVENLKNTLSKNLQANN